MASFLFHLGSEDIPATYQLPGEKHLQDLLDKLLKKDFFFLRCSSLDTFIGLRHVAFRLNDLELSQEKEEKKGPLVSLGEDVFQKFLHLHSLSKDSCSVQKNSKGEEYWVGFIDHTHKNLKDILSSLVSTLLSQFSWPKTMTWPQSPQSWVRPVRFITALLDEDIVPLTFFGQTSGNVLQGHRLLSSMKEDEALRNLFVHHEKNYHHITGHNLEKISACQLDETMGSFFTLHHANGYEDLLGSLGVMIHKKYHKDYLKTSLRNLLEPLGLALHSFHQEALLEENIGLVSWPFALLGTFEEKFLSLPDKVILNTLAHHQRCFCVVSQKDSEKDALCTLTNKFVVIADGVPHGFKETSRISPEKGYERVVRARLTDALFFLEEDQKKTLLDHGKDLDKCHFFEYLGSFGQKVRRLSENVDYVQNSLESQGNKECEKQYSLESQENKDSKGYFFKPEEWTMVKNLTKICKSSMVCSLVQEYPELQGFMGAYYAKKEGIPYSGALESYLSCHSKTLYPASVASSSYVQQWFKETSAQKDPRFLNPLDSLPDVTKEDQFSFVLGLLDTLDTLVGFFALGKIPTGSKDPMALRRHGHGFLKAFLSLKISLHLGKLLEKTYETYKQQQLLGEPWKPWKETLEKFLLERFDYLMTSIYGFPLGPLTKKIASPSLFTQDPLFVLSLGLYETMILPYKDFWESYYRLDSLLSQQAYSLETTPSLSLDTLDLSEPEEKVLRDLCSENWGLWPKEHHLLSWAHGVKNFLDNLHVQEESKKHHRLYLLKTTINLLPFQQ